MKCLIILAFLAPVLPAVLKQVCWKCGSFRTVRHVKRRLSWGSNFGDVLRSDPFYSCVNVKTCKCCGHTSMTREKWVEGISDDDLATELRKENLSQ